MSRLERSELYTSASRYKQSLNGGVLPPMTPVTGDALTLIDPASTIGLGALIEDDEKGLLCPVRGCGKWTHALGLHITNKHRALGGVSAVRKALQLSSSTPLETMKRREARSRLMHERRRRGDKGVARNFTPDERGRRGGTRTRMSMDERNVLNRCVAQTQDKLLRFSQEIGRAPTRREGVAKFGSGFDKDIQEFFGTWNAALAHCGISERGRYAQRDVHDALETLRAWHDAHGELPCQKDITDPERRRAPLLMGINTYLRLFKTTSWPKAMQIAASLLNIYGGRYGLPRPESAA